MTLQILGKRACPPNDAKVLKRWKPELNWPCEVVTPAAPPAPQVELDVKLEDREPTSVLDLQTSPGRSCSSSSGGSLSSQPSLSSDETGNSLVAATSTDESVHNDHDIASWMECMEGGLPLSDFAKCDDGNHDAHPASSEQPSSSDDATELEDGIEHLVNADIDFGFELGSFSMSDMLTDPGLCLMEQFAEGFNDAHRLLELDESLSSMMKSQGFEGSTSDVTTVEVVTEAPLDSGLQLVHLLLACAEAIDESDFESARPMLGRLKDISNPYGDPMQRIALYFADALSDRLEPPQASGSSPSEADKELAFQSFYEVLPFSKFAYLTANQAIFEAVGYHDKIHVVDLDIQQGLQWPSFLQTLAMRPGGPPHLHLSAVGTNVASLELTQRRLREFARALDVPFEFTIVVTPLQTLTVPDLHLATGAALAVNCPHVLRTLPAAEAEDLLLFLHSLNPEVVTLLEVEASHNGRSLLSRFVEALHYYCALFDALEGSLARDSPDRFLIENTTCFTEIRGIVGQEVGHAVKSETWHKTLTKCAFRSKPLSSYSVQQAQLLLAYFASGDATPYKLSEASGALVMGWQETPVMAVSSWSC